MTRMTGSTLAVGALAFLFLFVPRAAAQSTISGTVKDSSGAVMAGVKVDAASDALIEKSRVVTTNGEGRYAIVDVRPGTYTVTFTTDGFNAVKQQVQVPANVTVPVDAEMKPGAVGQTVEVRAQIATVDVEKVAHPEVLTRSDIDALPTARNLQSVGSYIPSVHLNQPDVAGSQQIQQTYMATHGNPAQHNIILMDGMLVNTTQGDGQIQTYIDNELIQEATYQTSNVTVDASGGGVFVNLVPKDGGNTLHGEFFGAHSFPVCGIEHRPRVAFARHCRTIEDHPNPGLRRLVRGPAQERQTLVPALGPKTAHLPAIAAVHAERWQPGGGPVICVHRPFAPHLPDECEQQIQRHVDARLEDHAG